MVKGINKVFGYARVSTTGQNLDSQIDALKEAGAEIIFQEKITGTKKDRVELKKMIQQLRKGDKVVIYDLSRLGRNTQHLLEIVDDFKNMGVDLLVLKGIGNEPIDTSTATGQLMFTMFSAISQFQADQIREKTHAGLAAARARGRKGGRPFKNKKDIEYALSLYDSKKYTIAEIEKKARVSRGTLYRYLSKRSK